LYCQLLKDAANSLRGIKTPKLVSTELNLDFVTFALETAPGKLAASIPQEYIYEPRLRLEAYRRLASMTTEEELDDYKLELRDKFGKIPLPAENFLTTVRIRIILHHAGWSSLSFRDSKIFLERNGEMYRKNGVVPKIPPTFSPKEKLEMLLYFAREVRKESQNQPL
jgi:transcription-repair coupling factor (superfamily II helicase)